MLLTIHHQLPLKSKLDLAVSHKGAGGPFFTESSGGALLVSDSFPAAVENRKDNYYVYFILSLFVFVDLNLKSFLFWERKEI